MALGKGGKSVPGESKEAKERQLNQGLREIVEHAYKNAPAVKDKFDIAGVPPSAIRTIKDLEKIPVTTKDELLKLQRANPPFGGFLAVPITNLSRIYISPGPIYDPWDRKRVPHPTVQRRSFCQAWRHRDGLVHVSYGSCWLGVN
jgi:hypothetical protein